MKPLAASVVISFGGSMSALWLDGGGIMNWLSGYDLHSRERPRLSW